MDRAILFNKEPLHLISQQPFALSLLNAGNARKKTQQNVSNAAGASTASESCYHRFTVAPSIPTPHNKLQHEECCALLAAKQPIRQCGCSPNFHLLMTHSLESFCVYQVACASCNILHVSHANR